MRIRLRHRRLALELGRRGKSQNAWARMLGLDSGHLSKLVNGQRLYPGPETRRKLLEGLGLEFEELFEVEIASRRRGGSVERRECRKKGRGDGLMELGNDVRYALRQAHKSPGFSALAVLIVGLGLGAVTSVFSTVDAVLVDPLPFPESERLVLVY